MLGLLGGLLATQLQLQGLLSYWRSSSPLVVAAALVGALLCALGWRSLVRLAVALLLGLWLVVCFTPLAARLAQPLVRRDPLPARADAIFVFSSSLQPDGEPTATAAARLLRGLELLAERRAPRLLVTELPPPIARVEPLLRAEMARLSLPGELLALGPIRNTHDEALVVADLCRQHGWRTVIAVSSPTHTRRAAAVLEAQGLEVFAAPSVETLYDLEGLYRPDDRLPAFGAALHDLVGYRVYQLRGWIRRP